MTYACPAWEFETENHLLKLERLQNRVLRTIDNFPRHTSVSDMHVVRLRLHKKIVQEASKSHPKS
jgi:hypothetical protein